MNTDKQVPLTMSAEREAWQRQQTPAPVWAELDAERAAHAATREQLAIEKALRAQSCECRFEAERDALKEQLAQAQNILGGKICGICWTVSWEPTPNGERCGYCWLHERAEAALKDTERLDWRETHPRHGFGLHSDGTWADGHGGSHATYREAIDAALRAKQEPPQHALHPAEGSAEDTTGLQRGKP